MSAMVSIHTAFRCGVEGRLAEVEAVKVRALPTLLITGLVGDIVRESRERVLGCLANLGFIDIPSGKVVVHLCPAGEKKQGSHFDLAIALALLSVEGKIPRQALEGLGVLGELTLDGRIRRVTGATTLIDALLRMGGDKRIIVPQENVAQAALLSSDCLRLAENLSDVVAELRGAEILARPPEIVWSVARPHPQPFRGVLGQCLAKRALQIAVAGRHHLLMVGSPGVGKSLLAHAAADLQPSLTREEVVETSRVCEGACGELSWKRPFRSPHHSVSASAFLGGGSRGIVPGEVTLAHRGILFMDEFPEFRRDAVEGLREPLETGQIHLHRVGQWVSLPARFTLIAAMNPCPCGYAADGVQRCRCTAEKLGAYQRRVSGPILDRMDMTVVLDSRPQNNHSPEYSIDSVQGAFDRQRHRFRECPQVERNGDMAWGENWRLLNGPSNLEERIREFSREPISLRAIHKVARVARTIADLENSDPVLPEHVREAWELRCRYSVSGLIGSSSI